MNEELTNQILEALNTGSDNKGQESQEQGSQFSKTFNELVSERISEPNNEVITPYEEETAIIADGTRIVGNIKTKGHVIIAGTVEGDVSAAGNIMISGNIRGNVKAQNAILESGQLISNLDIEKQIVIKQGVVFNGDIVCTDIQILGIVNGNIEAKGHVGLMSTAKVSGVVKCENLGMEIGAKLNGTVEMR